MIQWTDSFGIARSFVSDHTVEVLMGVIVAVGIAVILAVWSLLRRSGLRHLRRALRDMQRRLDALELAEHERTLRRIVAPGQPPA